MQLRLPRFVHASLASMMLSTCVLGTSAAAADDYPQRSIRVVVPSAPGGGGDFVARLIGEKMGRALKQSVVVENRGGGGGNIATEVVRSASPDGYTLLLTGNNHPLNVHLFKKAPYALADFVAVVEATRGPSVLVAANNAPFSTLQELIAQAKAQPNAIAFGSPGFGLPSHVAAELFQRAAEIKLVHAPYRGSGPSLADAVGGQIPMVSSTLSAALPLIQSGKVRALAVTSDTRWPALPNTPTVSEVLGKPFSHLTWLGILAPAGTPPEVVAKLNSTINEILKDKSVRDALVAQGTLSRGGSAADFEAVIQQESALSAELVQSGELKAE